jgi:hypothetical protein
MRAGGPFHGNAAQLGGNRIMIPFGSPLQGPRGEGAIPPDDGRRGSV